jgi:GLPGLI family protein
MKYIIILITLCITNSVFAQTNFITKGKISFERRVSQFKINESETEDDNIWMAEMKKVMTKTPSDIYTLNFTEQQSYYKLAKENSDNKYMFGVLKPIENNYVLQDLVQGKTTMTRAVFENEYQLEDSIRQYEWKLTGEVRDIIGFECKKAVTKICDSVVVVAFYTDQIPVKSGPENFNGLPGMILGLAVPRLAATWFATKIELVNDPIPVISSKGKKVKWGNINKELAKGLRDWGKQGHSIAWLTNL